MTDEERKELLRSMNGKNPREWSDEQIIAYLTSADPYRYANFVGSAEVDCEAARRIRNGEDDEPLPESGYQRLWRWFGLSYASFLVLPRVLMHEMPDRWQNDMAALLEEYQDTFKGVEGVRSAMITLRGWDGRFMEGPNWLTDYRHPDREKIEERRRKTPEEA